MNEQQNTSENLTDINILLLGQTGVGKTTFINALANYLSSNSLKEALNHELQVLVPSLIYVTDQNTFEEKTIQVGDQDPNENLSEDQSATQLCQSFIFPLSNIKLRLIDTPGTGDTKGIEQDELNMREILAFISQYSHLNGICVFLKPNESRMSIQFRYTISALLRHLHSSAKDNLQFVITNGRSSFYRPGSSKKILQAVLEENRQQSNIEIPFNGQNTFIFDNECFRFLAVYKDEQNIDDDMIETYERSWQHSTDEWVKLFSHTVQCPIYRVRQMITLNQAEQIIRKLPRPLAETQRLIEQNIELAKNYRRLTINNPQLLREGIPQNKSRVVQLPYPRTVCSNQRCSPITQTDSGQRRNYSKICHDHCFLKGVIQETLRDEKMRECEAFDYQTGRCNVCGCRWSEHIHITYEYTVTCEFIGNESTRKSSNDTRQCVDQRIEDLRAEADAILDVYQKLVKFYQANSLLPVHDQLTDYLQLLINEEEQLHEHGADNLNVIENLKRTKREMENARRSMLEVKTASNSEKTNQDDQIPLEDVFPLVQKLYELPINGKSIREQIEKIEEGEKTANLRQDKHVKLSVDENHSKMLEQLNSILINSKRNE